MEVKASNSSSDEMVSPEDISRALDKCVIGRSVVYVDETTSTNDEAKKLAEEGAVEGTAVIASTQSAGRGRLGREWISPRGGVWMSVILRPPSIRPAQKLTLLAGLSVAKTLEGLYNIDVGLKWPNDVLVGKRKICGILTEGAFHGEAPLFVIVGIGLNANIDPQSLPQKLGTEATSVSKLLRRDVSLNELITRLLKTMDTHYTLFARGEDKDLWHEYETLCTTIGSTVRVECGEEFHEGLAKGISPDGGLIIRSKMGSEITVLAGDCVHLAKKAKKTRKNIRDERRKLRK
jgi:BirA family biotin operon repressor/biotin-[acetyl-CoA-carboxylase] ligase